MVIPMGSDGFDRDTYQYGDREAERAHAMRELKQLQFGLMDGVLCQREYEKAAARVRRRHGLLGWNPGVDG
jgi:hypothetical protein